MKNISKFDHCFGCGVCSLVCPRKIISMTTSSEGFFSPILDNQKCIDCQLCLKTCAFNSYIDNKNNEPIKAYSVFSNDEKVRNLCSSGGVGFELAKYALLQGYVFCGVKYNVKKNRAEHYLAKTLGELYDSCGSKYIQSYTVDAFSQFNKDEKYFVVGTPCQIDSLRRFFRLKKIEDNFILVDFFCHGVPSYLMWDKYLKEYGLKNATEVRWRDKRTGWHDSWNMVFRNLEKESSSLMSKGDIFYRFFLKNRCLGKACYDDCKYKMTNSAADIRIGDLWGTKYQNNEEGISGVVTFTQKGDDLLKQLEKCTIIPESLEVVTESQMKKCAQRPSSYNYVIKSLMGDARLLDVDRKASQIEFIYDVIPHRIKYYTKRLFEKILCK